MCVLSGLKLLSCSLLRVCGSVLFLILQEAAETHTGMNRSFRGLKRARDEISMPLTSHSLRRKMFLKTLTLSLTVAMPLAQQRLTITDSRNWKSGKRTQKAWDRPAEFRTNMRHPSEDTAPEDDIYTDGKCLSLTWKMNKVTKIGVWLLNTSPVDL